MELRALYNWLYFSKPIMFLFFVVVFSCFILHAMDSPGCTNLFFFYMIFFPWLHAFYTRLFSKSLACCPFQLAFFFKTIGFLLLLTGLFQSHEVIKDGTFTFLRSGCNRLIRMDLMKSEVHNCVLYSD